MRTLTYVCSLPLEPPSHLPRLSKSTGLELPASYSESPLAHCSHTVKACFLAALSVRPTLSLPHCVHKSTLSVCSPSCSVSLFSPMTTTEARLSLPVVSQQHLHTVSISHAWPPGQELQPRFPIQHALLLTLRVSTPCPCVPSLYPWHFLPFSASDLSLFCREAPGPLPLVLI